MWGNNVNHLAVAVAPASCAPRENGGRFTSKTSATPLLSTTLRSRNKLRKPARPSSLTDWPMMPDAGPDFFQPHAQGDSNGWATTIPGRRVAIARHTYGHVKEKL
jgi:hypothetical protein